LKWHREPHLTPWKNTSFNMDIDAETFLPATSTVRQLCCNLSSFEHSGGSVGALSSGESVGRLQGRVPYSTLGHRRVELARAVG
jgi:hypothetical protein